MKSRRKHGFQFMTILYFLIVFCMCVSRFNVIMTIMGGQLTRVEEIIAIFKNKANSRRNGTSLSSQKAKLSEKHIVSRSEEHPASSP